MLVPQNWPKQYLSWSFFFLISHLQCKGGDHTPVQPCVIKYNCLRSHSFTRDSLLLHCVCGLFKLSSKAENEFKIKKTRLLLKYLKKSVCSINVACINLKTRKVLVFWNARAAFSGISWPLSPLETKMVLN